MAYFDTVVPPLGRLNHIKWVEMKNGHLTYFNFIDMKESQTFGIQFIVRKNKEKETGLTIFARITINGIVSEISLKQNISSKDWNPAAEMGKGRKVTLAATLAVALAVALAVV